MRRLLAAVGVATGMLLALVPLLGLGLYLTASVAGGLLPGPTARVDGPAGPPVRIGLIAGPLHYDVLLPLTPALRDRLAFAARAGVPVDHPGADWLLIGWGSRAFYTTAGSYADIAPGAVWTAATGDSAVMRLDVTGALPPQAPGIDWLDLTPGQARALTDELLGAITGTARIPDAGFTATDAFFPAAGRFHLLRTCNVWLGERLRRAGVPVGLWTPTPFSLRLSLGRLGAQG